MTSPGMVGSIRVGKMLKATTLVMHFGNSVLLSGDGHSMAVGAPFVNNAGDNDASDLVRVLTQNSTAK